MNGVLGRAKIVWVRAGKVILATAACIARCCRRCPGPVLRRKCDRYCPDTTTAYGFWRIDLDAPIAPGGVTWRQWIADNDAALTPCRLIQFGTDPENCYVLDRNCSRCFWSGCNYSLDIPSLPVVPPELVNPRLATCDDCILCIECCASMVWRDCSGMDRCYECGSNYRVASDLHVRSTYQTFNSLGANTYDETLTKDITQEVEWLCVDTDPGTGRCNTSTMRDTRTTTFNATARFTVNEGSPPVRRYIDLAITRTGGTGVVDSIGPSGCGQFLQFWQMIESGSYIGAPPPLSSLTTAENILYMPVRGNAVTSQSPGNIMRTQCVGTFYVPTFFPGSTDLSTETWRTWSVAFNGSSGTCTYRYERKTYQGPQGQTYLSTHNVATMTRNFQFSRIAPCEIDAPLGCNDPVRRKPGDPSGTGNTPRDAEGIIGG